MRRSGLLIALLVLVAIGVPVLIALAGGGDDEPNEQAAVQRDEGAGTPPSLRPPDGPGSREEPARGGRGGGDDGDGPPPHAASYDEQMKGVGYPESVTEAGGAAAEDATRVLGRQAEPGQRTVFAADCRDGTCSIRYRSSPRGGGRLAQGQAALVRRLFAREDVERVVLYVHHSIVGRNKEERPAFEVVRCERGDHSWSRLSVKTFKARCQITHEAGGKVRNQIRRGQLSVEDASRGRDPGVSSGGARDGSGAVAGGDGKMPRNVPGSGAAERRARQRHGG